ncbi:hypothetical protein [Synechococcus elongatus]|uniref:hypothetical protein n=1 Tax=Synechococcus elongatus TaxID=32046 RepID=UPI0030D0C75D
MLDREGRVLASSRHVYSLYVWPLAIKDERWPDTRKRLAKLLNLPGKHPPSPYRSPERECCLSRATGAEPQSTPVIAFENRRDFIGVEIDYDSVRYYPNGSVAARFGVHRRFDEELKRKARAIDPAM